MTSIHKTYFLIAYIYSNPANFVIIIITIIS